MELLFFLTAFFSEIIGTIIGFGSSTVLLPFAVLFFDFKTALILVSVFHIFGNIGRISFFKSALDKRILIRFGIPSILFTLAGSLLISISPQNLLKMILGLFLIVFSFTSIKKVKSSQRDTDINLIAGGALSGFFAGLIGTGGALRSFFLTRLDISKDKYIATMAILALIVDLTRVPVYFSYGFLDKKLYWYLPILLLIAILGSYIGKKLVQKIAKEKLKKIILTAILIVGIKFIFDYFFNS